MRYIAEKMLKASRFRDLEKTLTENECAQTIQNINRLLDENKEYADSKNYGHLCNLLSALALVQMYEAEGKTRTEAQHIVLEAMYRYLEPQIPSMQHLAAHRWFVSMLKIAMPIKFRHTLGYGWSVSFPKAPHHQFVMVTHSCIYAQIFTKYGMPEMTKGFCRVDNLLYDNLPNTKFFYTERIGEGGSQCDYCYERVK